MAFAEWITGQPAIVAFFVLMLIYGIGEVISLKTKAFLPAAFIFALLTLITIWTGVLPSGIFPQAGIGGAFATVVQLLIVINMGSSMAIQDITRNWRVVAMGIAAILGSAAFILLVGTPIFGWQTAVVSAPVVAGGIVASLEMQQGAMDLGQPALAVIAALILAFQSFPGFLLTPVLLKKAFRADLKKQGKAAFSQKEASKKPQGTTCKLPAKYQSTPILLMITAAIGVLAVFSTALTRSFMGNFAISTTIFALLYGVVFASLGWIPQSIMAKASSNGLLLILTILNAFSILATTTFAEVQAIAGPIAGTIALGIVGIFIACGVLSKIYKMDWRLAVALGLNCLLGFPLNYQLTVESVTAVTANEEEAKYLMDKYMPMMLVAGFVTITIGSVFLAGLLRNFL